MARHYATRDFFRQMPNPLLARYFHACGVFADLDIAALPEPQPDALWAAWLTRDDTQRHAMDAAFQDIAALSGEKGWRAILMEDPNDALHDPDPAADKRRCHTVRRSVALSTYWYERVRQVATSTNLKPGVILRNAIKLGLVQLEQQARPEGKRTP